MADAGAEDMANYYNIDDILMEEEVESLLLPFTSLLYFENLPVLGAPAI